MRNRKLSEAVHIILCLIFLSFLAYISNVLPGLFWFTLIFGAVPITICYVKFGRKTLFYIVPAAALICAVICREWLDALFVFSAFTLSGIAMGICFSNKSNLQNMLLHTSMSYLLVFLTNVFIRNKIFGTNVVHDYLKDLMTFWMSGIEEVSNILASTSESTPAHEQISGVIDRVVGILPSLEIILMKMVPSFFIFFALIPALISMYTSRKILYTGGFDVSAIRPFHKIRAAKSVAYVTVIISLMSYIIDDAYASAVLGNAGIVLGGILLVCGISVLQYFMITSVRPMFLKVILNILLFTLFFVFSGSVIYIMGMLGFFDALFNFRRLGTIFDT